MKLQDAHVLLQWVAVKYIHPSLTPTPFSDYLKKFCSTALVSTNKIPENISGRILSEKLEG